jgi:Homoserine acetyltransferase
VTWSVRSPLRATRSAGVEAGNGAVKERGERKPEPAKQAQRLVHETWGAHEALLARSRSVSGGRVGPVATQCVTVASEEAPFVLGHGGALPHVEVAFETYGRLNDAADNAILIAMR